MVRLLPPMKPKSTHGPLTKNVNLHSTRKISSYIPVCADESGDENEFSQDMEQAAEKIAKKLSGVLYRAGSLGQNAQSKNAHLIEKMIKAKEGFGKVAFFLCKFCL